jgi:hypothetical protein
MHSQISWLPMAGFDQSLTWLKLVKLSRLATIRSSTGSLTSNESFK